MLWKRDSKKVSLVVNPAPYPKDSSNYIRQRYCIEILQESTPWWVIPRFPVLEADDLEKRFDGPEWSFVKFPPDPLGRDSKLDLDEGPPLPSVREMMEYAMVWNDEWAGVAVSDLIFTSEAWPIFQRTEAQIVIARASQVPDVLERDRITATPIKKWNEISMDALFVRGKAKDVFMSDFPDVFLAECWDDAAQAWARRHRGLGLALLNNHETMHRVHDPDWQKGAHTSIPGIPTALRTVGVWNMSKVDDFRKRRGNTP